MAQDRTRSLIFKISMPIMVISISAFWLLGIVSYFLFSEVVNESLDRQSTSMTQIFSDSIREDLLYGLDKDIYAKCQGLLNNKLVSSVHVTGLGGRIICPGDPNIQNSYLHKNIKVYFSSDQADIAGTVDIQFENIYSRQLLRRVLTLFSLAVILLLLSYWALSFFFLKKETKGFTTLATFLRDSEPNSLEDLSIYFPQPKSTELQILCEGVETLSKNWRSYQKEVIKNERLQAANETSRILAHDIKNPLAAIKVVSQLITEKPEMSRNLLAKGVQRIESMLDNILENDGQEDPFITFEIVDLTELIGKIIDEYAQLYPKVEFVFKELGVYRASIAINQLDRAIRNLIKNAVEVFDSQKGVIRVTLEKRTDVISIKIQDSGPGLPQDILEQIGTGRINSQKPGGTGLGLFQVTKAISLCKGTMEISTSSQGCIFSLHLPAPKT